MWTSSCHAEYLGVHSPALVVRALMESPRLIFVVEPPEIAMNHYPIMSKVSLPCCAARQVGEWVRGGSVEG